MQEELEKGQTFTAPVVNILHETAEAARTNSTYVQARVAGEPRMGAPTNKQPDWEADPSVGGVGGNSASYHAASTVGSVAGSVAGSAASHDGANGGGFNPSTFGANSGIKHAPLHGNHLYDESPTAGPTASSTAEGNPASSSLGHLDPLASLLDAEFSTGPMHVGYHSTSVVHDGVQGGAPGVPKHKIGSLVQNGSFNGGFGSIDEDKSYKSNLSGGQQAFDSYLGADSRCVLAVFLSCFTVITLNH